MRTAGNEIGRAAEASTWVRLSGMLRLSKYCMRPVFTLTVLTVRRGCPELNHAGSVNAVSVFARPFGGIERGPLDAQRGVDAHGERVVGRIIAGDAAEKGGDMGGLIGQLGGETRIAQPRCEERRNPPTTA